MKTISKQADPEGYLEVYPKNRASTLNTMFTGFALYHHGLWLILDRYGSEKAKALIQKSKTSAGFWACVEGYRNNEKIRVTGIRELTHPTRVVPDGPNDEARRAKMREDFKKFNL
jgi:hypothetical protein